jgi:DNA-binding FadR family transcriptional regulator
LSTRIAELTGRGDSTMREDCPRKSFSPIGLASRAPWCERRFRTCAPWASSFPARVPAATSKKPAETAPHHLGAVGFGPVNSLAEVRKCYEFRIGLEGEAAYYAAQNRTPETLAAMREALKRMEAAISRGLVGMSADLEFHMAVARASENEFFEAAMQSMRMPIEFAINLARSLTLTRPLEHLRVVQTEHVMMFEAIEAQDKDAARLAMRAHIEDACMRIFERLGGGSSRTAEPRT